jgi:hypothetical protein
VELACQIDAQISRNRRDPRSRYSNRRGTLKGWLLPPRSDARAEVSPPRATSPSLASDRVAWTSRYDNYVVCAIGSSGAVLYSCLKVNSSRRSYSSPDGASAPSPRRCSKRRELLLSYTKILHCPSAYRERLHLDIETTYGAGPEEWFVTQSSSSCCPSQNLQSESNIPDRNAISHVNQWFIGEGADNSPGLSISPGRGAGRGIRWKFRYFPLTPCQRRSKTYFSPPVELKQTGLGLSPWRNPSLVQARSWW